MNPQLLSILNQAIHHFQSGNLQESERLLVKIIQIEPVNPPALQILGLIKATQGNYLESSKLLKKAVKCNPNDPGLIYNLAKVLSESGNDNEAITFHEKAAKLTPNNPDIWINFSKSLVKTKKFQQAFSAIDKAINLSPNNADAWNNRGAVLKELGKIGEAIESYKKALNINPAFEEALYNQGIALMEGKKNIEAIKSFDRAIELNPAYYAALNNKGIALTNLMRHDAALLAFDQCLNIKPDYIEAGINKAVTLSYLRKYDTSLKILSSILKEFPNNPEVWNNKGLIHLELKESQEALNCFGKALNLKPDSAQILINQGIAMNNLKLFEQAIKTFEKVLRLYPDYELIPGTLLGTKMQICNWENFSKEIDSLCARVQEGKLGSIPFSLLALTSSESIHLQAAKNFISAKYPPSLNVTFPKTQTFTQKIRLGYFSADFHNHATAYLMAELFELHDKDKFELFAFSFGPSIQDQMRARMSAAFNTFIDVRDKSDYEIAKLSNELNIQIAVDLKGFTQDGRTGIFANRAAPIQISYLGYPGTMGAEYIDYIIADRIVIPQESQKFYTEKVLYLPNCYQVNDSKREISNKKFSPHELGLPDAGFIFCSFNNSYKITPHTFKSWMQILKKVDGSVLWLLQDNPLAAKNLRAHASSSGVDPNRLIFAERLPLPDHLARHRLANLFLDTLPYNAHTTASDALWAGLPVLTQIGESFASRVSASLLSSIGLPELITRSTEEYESLAVSLAKNPAKLVHIKDKLELGIKNAPLFDARKFTKDIENLFLSAL